MSSLGSSVVARRYAAALLALVDRSAAVELSRQGRDEQVEGYADDLRKFIAAWHDSADLRVVLSNPTLPKLQTRQLLRQVCERLGLAPMVANALLLLSDRHRLAELPGVLAAYEDLADVEAGRLRADVTTAADLPESYFHELRKSLELVSGKQVRVVRYVDSELIAGVVTRMGDRVFDGSVRGRLQEMQERLTTPPNTKV